MMTAQFERDVERAYSTLRELIRQSQPGDDNPGYQKFAEILLSERYDTTSTNDPITIHLAVISSEVEWETLCQSPVPGSSEVIGELCRRVRDEGLKHFDLTLAELAALRNGVLYGDQRYNDYQIEVRDFKERYQKAHSYESLRHLLELYIQFERFAEAKTALHELRQFCGEESDADVDLAMIAARYYRLAGIQEADAPDVLEVLSTFGANEESNRLFAQYNPVAYMREWAELIISYLSALESSRASSESGDDSLESTLSRALSSRQDAVLAFEPEFVSSLSDDELDLMKKHDELLLELVQYCPEQPFFPIFRGTGILLWYKRLNLVYPGKLEYLLMSGIPKAGYRHPLNMTTEELMERLNEEFPEKENEIRDYFEESEETEQDDGEEEEAGPVESI